jgi:hypothetical protein
MKIIALIKTYSGGCWAVPSLESIYDFCHKIVYLHSNISWDGKEGNDCAQAIEDWCEKNDKAGKIDTIWLDTKSQEEQYNALYKHADEKYPDHDFKMLIDCDELWSPEMLALSTQYLTRCKSANAFTCNMKTYIKSPFFQIEPLDACAPVIFVRKGIGYMGVRGSGTMPRIHMEGVIMHHFSGVRRNLHLVWEKHAVSSMVENEPILDKKLWVETRWNMLPNARNFHPNTNYQHTWQRIKVVKPEDLPPAAQRSPFVKAFAGYRFGLGMCVPVASVGVYKKYGLAPDFGPGHADWNVPSKQAKYKKMVDEITRTKPPSPVLVEKKTSFGDQAPASSFAEPNISSLPPSKRNKLFAGIKNEGTCCVVCVVSGVYQWYIPIFHYCLSRAYPEYFMRIYTRGPIDLPPGPWDRVIVRDVANDYPPDGYTTAALRFVYEDEALRGFDYVHFQDIDMMIMRENPLLIDQHMMHLRVHGLQCYENYVSSMHEMGPRLPGVHFVTRDWWDRTRTAREKYAADLMEGGSKGWFWDEVMLAKIVKESGLPLQDKELHLWAHHGIHLGDYRRRIQLGERHGHIEALHTVFMKQILNDKELLRLFDVSAEYIDTIPATIEAFANIVSA